MRANRAARNTRRSIRSTRTTPRTCASPGGSRPTTTGVRPDYNMQVTPLMVNGVHVRAGGHAPRGRRASIPKPASSCGCGGWTRASAAKARRARARAVASRTGPTARATSASSRSRPAINLVALNAKTGMPVRDLRPQRHRRSEDRARPAGPRPRRRPISASTRRPLSATTSSSSAPRTRREARRAPKRTSRATCAASTCAPASGSGSSTPSRSPANTATRRGRTTRGRTPATPATGARSRSTKRRTASISRRRWPRATTTAAIGRARTCSPTASSASISTPASAIGTSSRSITTSGTGTSLAPGILMDITVDGKPIKAIGVPSKQGWLYTFDRMTGQPVWPIVERPVEKGNVPGEWYSPTQPFPTKPAPFDRQGVSEADLIDWTPEIEGGSAAYRRPPQDRADLHAADRAGRRRQGGHADAARTPPAARTGKAAPSIRKRGSSTSSRRPIRRG